MSRKQSAPNSTHLKSPLHARQQNKTHLRELLDWLWPAGTLFSKTDFHGNTKWDGRELVMQALLWSWQETRQVTDAFDHAQEVCAELGLQRVATSYTSLMNALDRYRELLSHRLRVRFQQAAQAVAGADWQFAGWVPIAFDGSRTTAPRTVSNERAFCAPHYGQGTRAKYGKKKSRGLRRERIQQHPVHPPAPQVWVTMLWHMQLRLPWTWRLGPSNASEREHVQEVLTGEEFPKNTLFCGDAGFVGYPLWSLIRQQQQHFLVRVGGNVQLLRQHADLQQLRGGIVLCWPKAQQHSGQPPLRLRLVRVKIGKTKMWLLTSVLGSQQLSRKQIIRCYKLRWGIEVEFRGLKQTLDKHALRCRNAGRLLVELDWSLRGMAIAELLALRAQQEQKQAARTRRDKTNTDRPSRSLANTLRALRKCMRNLCKFVTAKQTLQYELAQATVQRYDNQTDKRARYRPKNPDKKPLGNPKFIQLTATQTKLLRRKYLQISA